MEKQDVQGELFQAELPSQDVVHINGRCLIRTSEGHRVVLVSGIVMAQYAINDAMSEALVRVNLVEQGWADQTEVARAFGCSDRTVRRLQRKFDSGGLEALAQKRGYPKGRPRLAHARRHLIHKLKAHGLSNYVIAERIGVSEKAVRKTLRRLGWKDPKQEQMQLPVTEKGADPKLSGFSAGPESGASSPEKTTDPKLSGFQEGKDLPSSFDTDPSNRRFDRLMACLGLIDDAAPLFLSGKGFPRAGVLLAVPALAASGILECAEEVYGTIGPAFYGLRTTLVAFLFMALLRIKRPEAIKEHPPADLGRILGLDRAPEVKTLRRKLTRLAAFKLAVPFGRALAKRRVAEHGAALGFLYVDGHVRVYHGKRKIPKTHVARMRLPMPGTTDYWVNDTRGEPFFVVTAEANAGLVKMLPGVMGEVRSLVGERRVTVVFDRGGWSPKLFLKLNTDGFDILTYRKGRSRKVPRSRFQECKARIDGQEKSYTLSDQTIFLLGRKLKLRQVTRLMSDGHQTAIVTSRWDLPAVEVAYRMFERWKQENFFKYLREEYALDVLVDYSTEPDNPKREVPNPLWRRLDLQVRKARAEVLQMPADLGLAVLANPESARPTMRGFKIAHAEKTRKIWTAISRYRALKAKRDKVPRRVPVEEVSGKVVKLSRERKHLTNLFKMVAYQAESDLVRLLAPHYKRVEQEGRTLIQSALSSAADIELQKDHILVRLAPLSSEHRTRAIAALCEELNRTEVPFPGTKLILRYMVSEGEK